MNSKDTLSEMETFYMALADKTRLRLLNLMRDQEVCVQYFTEVLGDSQPKISRHLAYLRNAGIVEPRRDGKWVHYRIAWPREESGRHVLNMALDWLESRDDMRDDRERYRRVLGLPDTSAGSQETIEYAAPKRADDRIDDSDFPDGSASAHNEIEEFLL
jgi:ArsR family transcriptional regulator